MTTPDAGISDRSTSPWRRALNGLRLVSWGRVGGEFALIVVGVLVALAVNNWNAEREEARAEAFALASIRRALSEDLSLLQDADTGYRARERRIAALLEHMEAGGAYSDTLRAGFGAMFGLWAVPLNRGPYEALKANDLGLIRDDVVRAAIVDVYERIYPSVLAAADLEENAVLEVLRPYFLREFRDIRFRESATPRNYDVLRRDRYFMNLVAYRLAVLRANALLATTTAISRTSEVIGLLDEALAKQKASLREAAPAATPRPARASP